MVGHYELFNINASCKSPNEKSDMIVSFLNTTTSNVTTLSNLDPGTFCTITIISVIRNEWDGKELLGNITSKYIERSSKEEGNVQYRYYMISSQCYSLLYLYIVYLEFILISFKKKTIKCVHYCLNS